MAGSRYSSVPANRWPYLSAALRGLDADLTALEEGGVGGGSVTQRESAALGVAARSGLQMHFGMYENSLTLAGLEQIEAWSGVLFDLKSITAEGASGWGNEWSGLQGSGWAINQYAAHPARLVYSIPLATRSWWTCGLR